MYNIRIISREITHDMQSLYFTALSFNFPEIFN